MSVHSVNFSGNIWTLSNNASRLALSREWGGGNDVFNFDHSGRPWNIFLEEVSYQRGLDNRIVAKWLDASHGRQRRWLSEEECRQMVKLAHRTANEFLDIIRNDRSKFEPDIPKSAVQNLRRACQFDLTKAEIEAETFQEIYLPVGILPPDQYLAILLQATEGCSFNQCTFCRFYENQPFHIKSPGEFREHVIAVRDFIGKGMTSRRSIFLGDANALVAPTDRLLEILDLVNDHFDVGSLGGIYAFLDGFSGEKKGLADYKALAAKGIVRVYIGLESGHDPLLQFLNKPGAAEDAIHAVHKLKSAGISVGVIILLGAGGKDFAAGHVRDTVHALEKMGLDLHDQLYFSELIQNQGSDYARAAFKGGIERMSPKQIEKQWQQIQVALHFTEMAGTPHMARYDVREFIY